MGLLSQQASLYTVVANPSPALPQLACLRWQPGNPFHASALCASVLDSALVACRLAQHPLPCSLGPPIGEPGMPKPLCLRSFVQRLKLGALRHVLVPPEVSMLAVSSRLPPFAAEAAVTEILLLAARQGALLPQNWCARVEGLPCLPAASTCTPCTKAVVRLSLNCLAGKTDLQTLASSLAPIPGSNLAALSAAVPCPSLPSEREAAHQQDSRMRQPGSGVAPGSANGSHAGELQGCHYGSSPLALSAFKLHCQLSGQQAANVQSKSTVASTACRCTSCHKLCYALASVHRRDSSQLAALRRCMLCTLSGQRRRPIPHCQGHTLCCFSPCQQATHSAEAG